MAISVAFANEVLQIDYLPGFQSQVNDEMSYFYKAIERNESATSGKKFSWHARYGRSGGVGSRSEDADLPEARARARKNIESTPKSFYGRMKISDRLMKASNGAAFVEELGQQMDELVTDSKNDLNRQLFGDGTGVLGTTSAVTTAATFVVSPNAKFLDVGMNIDIYDTTLATEKADNLEVLAVDKLTGAVTVSANVTTLVTDKVVLHDALNSEITGLATIMDTGNTIYNIDRSSNPWFDSNIFTLGDSDSLDDDYMEQAFDLIDLETGLEPDMIVAGYAAFRSLKNYLSAFQRYTTMEARYEAGHTVMEYNGVPVEKDKYQDDTTMDFLTLPMFELKHIGENFAWLDQDGAILSRVPNKAAYEATLILYAELCNKYPKAQFRYTNIQKSSLTPG